MKKFFVVSVVLFFTVLGLREWIEGIVSLSNALQPKSESSTLLRREASLSPEMGVPRARSYDAVVESPATQGSTPLEVADNYLRAHREEWKIQSHHELRPTVFSTPLGSRVKYVVYQDDMPIIGLDIQMQINRDLQVGKVTNQYRPLRKADMRARVLSPDDIVESAIARYSPEAEGSSASSPVLYVSPAGEEPELAYVVPMKERTPDARPVQVLFRATDGQVLGRSFSRVEF